MARVTVEDCIVKVPNRFELVAFASQRARDIASGAQISIERDNDKDSVISLREIAKGSILVDNLREELVKSFQRSVDLDELEGNEGEASQFNADQVAEEMKALQSAQPLEEEDEAAEGFSFQEEELDVKD